MADAQIAVAIAELEDFVDLVPPPRAQPSTVVSHSESSVPSHSNSNSEIAVRGNKLKAIEEELRNVENEILVSSLGVVHASVDFAEVTPGDTEPPPEWVTKYGRPAALKRLRIAQAAWLSNKDAPVGIRVATQIASSIIKSRSVEKAAPRQLSVTWVSPAAPTQVHSYPEIVVESE